MKVIKFSIVMILGLVLFTNCSSDDDFNQNENLSGVWNMISVSRGLQGVNVEYAAGQIEWNFNLVTNKLIVENNIVTTGLEDVYAGLDSGVYDIKILQNGETRVLFIEGDEKGTIILNTNLKIEDNITSDDGFIIDFVR